MPQGRQGREGRLTAPAADSWFVVNVADAQAHGSPGAGWVVPFERRPGEFSEFGINIQVILPGEPNCMYHRENQQEDFLVLHGECLLLVEGEERRLRAWDFVHCPPGTAHVFVGAGEGPCAILMAGTRKHDAEELLYPVDELALRHGAGVREETPDPRVAYAGFPESGPVEQEHAGLPWQAT